MKKQLTQKKMVMMMMVSFLFRIMCNSSLVLASESVKLSGEENLILDSARVT